MRATEHTKYLRKLAAETARERLRRAKQNVRDARGSRRIARARANEACKAARLHLREWSTTERVRVRLEIARLREELRLGLEERRARVRECCGSDRVRARAEADKLVAGTRAQLAELLDERRRERTWTRKGSTSRTSAASSGMTAAERRGESDHDVEVNLTPDQLLVWSKVKGKIKGSARRTRTEAFLEWLSENGADVARILEAEAIAAEKQAVREEAEARKDVRELARAPESKLRRYLATGRDLIGIAGIPLLSPLAAGAGVLARHRKARKAAEASAKPRRKLKLRGGAELRPKARPKAPSSRPPTRQPWAPMPANAPALPSSARTMEPGSTIDFGFTDKRGRAIGYEARPVEHRPGFANGPYFLRAYPTRDGKEFGASRALSAKRPELLTALLNKRMQAARERYAKQFKSQAPKARAPSSRPPAGPLSGKAASKAARREKRHAEREDFARRLKSAGPSTLSTKVVLPDEDLTPAYVMPRVERIQGARRKRTHNEKQAARERDATPLSGAALGPATMAFDELPAFAARVSSIAHTDPKVVRFHDDRAFLASVWDAGRPWAETLEQFKRRCTEAHQKGLLRLTRADLVGAMDRELVERSEVGLYSATFHFVALDELTQRPSSTPPRPSSAPPPPAAAARGLAYVVKDKSKNAGPRPWKVMVGEKTLFNLYTKTDADIDAAILNGDRSRAAEGYRRHLKYGRANMGSEKDARKYAMMWAHGLRMGPDTVGADDEGKPLDTHPSKPRKPRKHQAAGGSWGVYPEMEGTLETARPTGNGYIVWDVDSTVGPYANVAPVERYAAEQKAVQAALKRAREEGLSGVGTNVRPSFHIRGRDVTSMAPTLRAARLGAKGFSERGRTVRVETGSPGSPTYSETWTNSQRAESVPF